MTEKEDVERIILGLRKNKEYDMDHDKEYERLSVFVCGAVDGGSDVAATIDQQLTFFFVREELTRRKLAKALRQFAYKIQHYKAGT